MVSLASGADLVCWGPLKLHIILAFIIFRQKATALTQGLFVSFYQLCPSTPLHPHASSPLSTFGTVLPLWLKNTTVSTAALPPVPLVQLWREEAFGWGTRALPSWKCVSLFSQKATRHQLHILTAHFFSVQMCIPKRPCQWQNSHLQLKHFQSQFGVKVWQTCPRAVDGWMVIEGQGCW